MELNIEQFLSQLTTQFLGRNYDYLWMRTMLEQASSTHISGSTLITGSSHALNGMKESCWVNASCIRRICIMIFFVPAGCWNEPVRIALFVAL